MLLIKTSLAQSTIHGIGLFAQETISRGAVLWRFTPGFDFYMPEHDVMATPEPLRTFLRTYGWKSVESGLYCFASDDARFWNHSDDPNCLSRHERGEKEHITVAVRDIEVGEELTDNYATFDADWNGAP